MSTLNHHVIPCGAVLAIHLQQQSSQGSSARNQSQHTTRNTAMRSSRSSKGMPKQQQHGTLNTCAYTERKQMVLCSLGAVTAAVTNLLF
jgi:hypothetical protein